MQSRVTLREAKLSDISSIIDLFSNTIEVVNAADYSPREISEWVKTSNNLKRWEKAVQSQYFVLAENKGKLLGFGSIEANYLDFIYVHKDYQGQGVASEIYTALQAHANLNKCTDIVSDVSITARPFFIEKGFKVIQKNNNYRNGENLINYRMKKLL